MKHIVFMSVFLFSGQCLAQGKSVRGATGTGYGQFSWGTSLDIVQSLSPKLREYRNSPVVRAEESTLSRLRAARKKRGRKAWPQEANFSDLATISVYRRWMNVRGLNGRVELGFFENRLYTATVRLIVPPGKTSIVRDIVGELKKKYGAPVSDAHGMKPKDSDLEIHFQKPTGHILYLRLRATKKTPGLIKIVYRSNTLSEQVDAHLAHLDALAGRYAPKASKPLPRRKERAPKKRTRDKIGQQI